MSQQTPGNDLMKTLLSTVAKSYDNIRPGAGDCVRKMLCGCTEDQPCGEHAAKVLFTAEEKMLRDAILDVFDSSHPNAPRFFFEGHGVPLASGGFETVSIDTANSQRLDFADQVIARARKIKQFDGDEQIRQRR